MPSWKDAPLAAATPTESWKDAPIAAASPAADKPSNDEIELKAARERRAIAPTDLEEKITHGASLGLDRPFNAGLAAIGSTIMGHGPSSGWKGEYQADKEADAAYGKKHPIIAPIAEVGGGFATPVGDANALVKGGGLLARTVRGMIPAAGAGAVSGAANADPGLKNRAIAATEGAVGGAGLAGLHTFAVAPVASAIWRGIRSRTGAATETAIARLREHLEMDGVDKASIEKAINEWKHVGAGAPSLLDVAGENTMGLLRAAASKFGPGRNEAVANATSTRENLPAAGRARVASMTPEKRPATDVAKSLKEQRDALAETHYAAPYAHPVPVTPEIIAEIKDPEGVRAIDQAIESARAKKMYAQVDELEKLKKHVSAPVHAKETAAKDGGTYAVQPTGVAKETLENPATAPAVKAALQKAHGFTPHAAVSSAPEAPPQVSGGSLDRIRIALGKMGKGASKNDKSDVGSGLFDRANKLGKILDDVPHLKEARTHYREMTSQINAVKTGSDALSMATPEFKAAIQDMSPEALAHARVGARQEIVDAMGRGPRKTRDILTKIASADDTKDNLRALFGDKEANRLIKTAQLKVHQITRAQDISPRTGSQSQPRAQDAGGIAGMLTAPHTIIGKMIAGLDHASATMSPEEREALVRMGIGKLPGVLDKVLGNSKPSVARTIGSRLPLAAGNAAGEAAGATRSSP